MPKLSAIRVRALISANQDEPAVCHLSHSMVWSRELARFKDTSAPSELLDRTLKFHCLETETTLKAA